MAESSLETYIGNLEDALKSANARALSSRIAPTTHGGANMARHTSKHVHTEAARLGLVVQSWRPGDSYGTRYLFGKRTEQGGMIALSQTCRGSREAMAWLDGYAKGCR